MASTAYFDSQMVALGNKGMISIQKAGCWALDLLQKKGTRQPEASEDCKKRLDAEPWSAARQGPKHWQGCAARSSKLMIEVFAICCRARPVWLDQP